MNDNESIIVAKDNKIGYAIVWHVGTACLDFYLYQNNELLNLLDSSILSDMNYRGKPTLEAAQECARVYLKNMG